MLNRDKVLEVAERLVSRGKVDAAIQEYRKLLADTPKDIALLNKVGDLYVRINRNDEAVRLFLQLAARYSEDGFFVKAIAIYKKILKFDPTRLVVYEKLADLYHKQGLANEARAQYQVLVDYHQKHGDGKAASAVLEKMAELDPDDPTPRVKLAEAFQQSGDKDRELKEYRALAELMMRHGRFDEAGQIFAKAVAAAPDDLAFITDAVLGLKDAGQVGAAARLLTIAVERNPQAERIARLAGLGKSTEASTATPVRDTTSSGLRVRDVAAAPPELEVRPSAEPPRRPLDNEPEFVVELPTEEASPLEVRPTEEMLRRSPDSPWFEGAADADVEFDLELESIEEEIAPPAPAPGSGTPPSEIDWSFAPEPELELAMPEVAEPELSEPTVEPESAPAYEPWGDLAAELAPAAGRAASPSPPAVPVPPAFVSSDPPADDAVAFEVGLDLDELERTSYEVVPSAVPVDRRLGDLLAEAEVFRKYGLREKAHDRVREILQHDARHLETIALQIALLVDEGKHDKALARAQTLLEISAGTEAGEDVWAGVQTRLNKAGYRFEDGRPVAAPIVKKPKKDTVSALLAELGLEPKKGRPAAKPAAATPAPAPPAAKGAPAAPAPPPAQKRPAAAASTAPPLVPPGPQAPPTPSLSEVDEALAWLEPPAARPAPPPALSAPASRASASAPERPPSADEKLFEDEEGFFDLAAELEEELSKEELIAAAGPIGREEPSLEEIVEGFKKGVAESLSAEDYDTHFNLGIAYREMGLLDEAIGEFQLAAKDHKYLIDCCSLLGGCFLEKGLPELAIKWFRKGLEVPDLPEEATLGLLYDLGNLYLSTGEIDRAKKTFVEIYGVNSNYRDIVAKIEELGSR